MKQAPLAVLLSAALLAPTTLAAQVQPAPAQTAPATAALPPSEVQRLLDQGRTAEALAATRAAIHAKPDSAKAHLMLARIYARSGKTEQAQVELKRARALDPQVSLPTRAPQEIDRLIEQQAYPLALGALSGVLLTHPRDATAHYLVALAEARRGHLEAARTALQQAERLHPGLNFADDATLAALRRQLNVPQTSTMSDEALEGMAAATGDLARGVQLLPWIFLGTLVIIGGVAGLLALLGARRARAERDQALASLDEFVMGKSRAIDEQLVATRIDALGSPEAQARVTWMEEAVRHMFEQVKRAKAGEISPEDARRRILDFERQDPSRPQPKATPARAIPSS